MNACLQMDEGLLAINMMNLVVKILMQDMTASEMVVVVVGGLVIMAGMEDELTGVVMTTVCVLMMKNLMILITKRDLTIMKIPLQNDGQFERCRDHRWHAGHEDREHHRGRHNRDDLGSIACVS